MPLSTDVKLPRDYQPIFEDHCVRCHGDTFRSTFSISTHNIGWASFLVWWFIGNKVTVEVPACESCAIRMRVQRWGSAFATFLLVLLGLFFVYPFVDDLVARPLRRWVMLGISVICLSPLIAWELFWPPVFDITSTKKWVTYEFKNAPDAFAFAELNRDASQVEID